MPNLPLEDADSQRDRLYRRLTAYVHGELDAAEARGVEILMQRDEAVSHVVHGLVQLDEGLVEVLRYVRPNKEKTRNCKGRRAA